MINVKKETFETEEPQKLEVEMRVRRGKADVVLVTVAQNPVIKIQELEAW